MVTEEDLRRDNEFRLRVLEPGFTAREVVPPGGDGPPHSFFDPFFCFAEDDGSVVVMDIGGQPEPGWDPNRGHGSIWRLHPDDSLSPILPLGNIGLGCILPPVRVAPASFEPYGGGIVFCGQALPGRSGAKAPHAVYHLAPGADRPEIVALLPNAGNSVAFGIPGALVGNVFGREGTEHEGYVFFCSLMNCTVYRVRQGEATPWMFCDDEHIGRTIMPFGLFYGDDGSFNLYGREGTSYTEDAGHGTELLYWRIDGDRLSDDPSGVMDVYDGQRMLWVHGGDVAPEGFGAFGGQRFSIDIGSVDLMHVSKPEGALPYDAAVVRRSEAGVHVFADQLQSGAPACIFAGDRLLVSRIGRSYSTGEFHHTDGAIYEVRYTG